MQDPELQCRLDRQSAAVLRVSARILPFERNVHRKLPYRHFPRRPVDVPTLRFVVWIMSRVGRLLPHLRCWSTRIEGQVCEHVPFWLVRRLRAMHTMPPGLRYLLWIKLQPMLQLLDRASGSHQRPLPSDLWEVSILRHCDLGLSDLR
jgi:hypothetical protein